GAAANPFAEPFEVRLIRLYKKVKAGAHFIQTQPVFDLEIFSRWMEKVVEMGLHKRTAILAGVMPIRSVKTLLWMKNEVPGVKINETYIERMKNAGNPEEEGIKITIEIIEAIKNINGIRGIHLLPVMYESIVPIIIKEAKLDMIN
ncbi:MAG: methylenetetrahydrofolate reductase, partial [Calditrichota bacterium]